MSSYVTRKTPGNTEWFRHDRFGSPLQIARAAVVSKPLPQLHEPILRDLCQRLDIRADLEKARIVRLDRLNARLLEHDFGEPDAVRILGVSPRQVALVFAVPLQEGVDGFWGEMIFHVRFLFC